MKTKLKKVIVLLSAACMLTALAAGCGSGSTSATKTAAKQAGEVFPEERNDTPPAASTGNAENVADTEDTGNTENTENVADTENAEGKWHVLDPETAAAVDADFEGTVWHIAEDAFSIAETKTQILDDGSLVSSSPSSKANIPDSQLIHVVVDDDTYFYIRIISGNGEHYEDTEAGFGDLEEHMSVEMKGAFENDVFYATEIRMIKFS